MKIDDIYANAMQSLRGGSAWDHHFLGSALLWARKSKDPDKKVGAVIIGSKHETRMTGYNGFPRGIADTPERLSDKDLKRKLMVHAERNCIATAARIGVPLDGCSLYFVTLDETGIWGGAPCTGCVNEIIQAGIKEVVSPPTKPNSSWDDDLHFASNLLKEAGIIQRVVSFP